MHLNFSGKDLELFKSKGIKVEEVLRQLNLFRSGVPPVKIVEPATVSNGVIKVLSHNESQHYVQIYNNIRRSKVIYKFTPASGAATRMFKKLFTFLNADDTEPVDDDVRMLFANIKKLAFYEDLDQACQRMFGQNIEQMISRGMYTEVIKAMLLPEGLGYGHLPKALIKFHRYSDRSRTAMEEHLVEGLRYAVGKDDSLELHFTVSPEHRDMVEALAGQLVDLYKDYEVDIRFSFSIQDPSTDTIAVTPDNEPFRTDQGELLFRPGGHGTLIYNLNDLEADFIFIKNIDNVAPDRMKPDTETWFQVLAGYLYTLKSKIDAYMDMLEIGPTDRDLEDIFNFIHNVLSIKIKKELRTAEEKIDMARAIFNRPLRVAGMVKNMGQEGGGPFLVEYDDFVSPQIVEKAQIDVNNPHYLTLLKDSTHFNPTFMVLSVKDHLGKKYNLLDFVDEQASFITTKTYQGRTLKALERPGLWNGAMAFWNTVFVEVPLTVFNPVKTVFDLLKPNHQ